MGVRLPAEYQEVEYLRGKNCDIDLNYVPIVSPTLKITFKLQAPSDADIAGFSTTTAVEPSFIIDPAPLQNRFYNRWGSTGGVTYGANYVPVNGVIQSWEFGKVVKFGEEIVYTNTYDGSWGNNNQSMHLFGARNKHPDVIIYVCLLYDGEQCVRNLVPCYRKQDSEPGMYDLVSKTFYTNQGTGEFLVGPDVVNHISPRLMDRRRILIAKLTSLFRKVITSQTGLASFDTNVVKPMKVTCEFSPKQDLHGYDNPWPAGGGVNKLPNAIPKTETINGITYKLDEYGVFTITGTSTGTSECTFNLAESFVIPSGDPKPKLVLNNTIATNIIGFYFYNNTTQVESWALSPANRVAEYTAMQGKICTAYKVSVGAANVTVNMQFAPMIVENSETDYSFQSYSNICPIEGWDGADIQQNGANIFDGQHESGTISPETGADDSSSNAYRRSIGYFKVKGGASYYFVSPESYKRIFWYDSSYNFISSEVNLNAIKTAPTNARFARIFWKASAVSDPSTMISINYPSTDTVFHGYVIPTTFPINWQTEAGTIYGGTVTLNEDGSADVVSSFARRQVKDLSWSYYNTVLYTVISDAKDDPSNAERPICEQYSTRGNVSGVGDGASWPDNIIRGNAGTSKYVYIKDTRYTTASGFKSAEGELWLYYTLATPQTYHFDNIGQLQSFLGTNNVWSDLNGSITVEYYKKQQ